MVEFALVLPIILLLLFGMLQFALVLNARQTVAYAAQAAANGYAQTLERARGDAEARTAGAQLRPEMSRAGRVSYSLVRAGSETAIATDGTGAFGDLVVARVTYDFPSPVRAGVGAFRFPDSIGLSAEAVARIEAPGPSTSGTSPTPQPPPPSATPSPTATPTPTPTPRPTVTPTPTPARTPIRVAVCVDGFDGGTLYGASWQGRFLGGVNVLTAPAYRGAAPQARLASVDVPQLRLVGTWNNGQLLTAYNGWGWSFGWWYSPGTYTPTVTLAGYPPTTLPPITIVKTTRFDYRCSVGWAQ